MPAYQSSFTLVHAPAFEGMLFDSRPKHIFGLINGEAGEVAYGRVVCKSSSANDTFVLPADALSVAGILVHEQDHIGTTTGLPAGELGNVVSEGIVWMRVEDAATVDDPVYVRISGGSGAGTVRASDAGAAAFPLAAARFMRSAGAGALVPVAINLSGPAVAVVAS